MLILRYRKYIKRFKYLAISYTFVVLEVRNDFYKSWHFSL